MIIDKLNSVQEKLRAKIYKRLARYKRFPNPVISTKPVKENKLTGGTHQLLIEGSVNNLEVYSTIQIYYDTGHKLDKLVTEDRKVSLIANVLRHEYTHYVLAKEVSYEANRKFDNLDIERAMMSINLSQLAKEAMNKQIVKTT